MALGLSQKALQKHHLLSHPPKKHPKNGEIERSLSQGPHSRSLQNRRLSVEDLGSV